MAADSNTTRRGVAVVFVRDGRSQKAYEGRTTYDITGVHLGEDGRLRVRDDASRTGITYRQVGARSWPHGQVREVRWLELDREEA